MTNLHDFSIAAQGCRRRSCLVLGSRQNCERLIMLHGAHARDAAQTLDPQGCGSRRDSEVVQNDSFAEQCGSVGSLKMSAIR